MSDAATVIQTPSHRITKRAVPGQPKRRDTVGYLIKTFNRFLAGQRYLVGLAVLMLVAEAVTTILEPYPLAYLIDYLNGSRPDLLGYLSWLPLPATWSGGAGPLLITAACLTLAIILMAMINSAGDSMAEIYLAKVGRVFGFNLRTKLYMHLQKLSLAFHDRRRTGDVLTRVTGDVSALEEFVISSLSDIIGSLLVLVGTLGALFYMSWQVAVVALVIMPVMAFISNYFSSRIKVASKKQRSSEGELASAAQEMLSSIRVIQTYGGGDHALAQFADHNRKNTNAALQAAGLQARFSWVVSVSEAVTIALVVWLGLWLITHQLSTPGMLVVYILQIQKMFKPTKKIIKEWNTFGKVFASVERIGELLDRKPAVTDAPNAVTAPRFKGLVEFQQVNFAYQPDADAEEGKEVSMPVRQVLHEINLRAAPGDVFALVGHTGAGKSTIAQLLPRLYDPTGGRILIDRHDIRAFTIESLRAQISVVLQESILFTGTVADNIAYGRPDATPEEIVTAAKQANAHGFIEKLPNGYATILGERGANLSGGQRQRIAIARALVRNTPILILDEPTTGLDNASAEMVLQALRVLMKGKTTIIISHDLKLVRQADKIVVIKAGKVEEMGTHDELLTSGGSYSDFYTKQFEPAEEVAPALAQAPTKAPVAVKAPKVELMQSKALDDHLPTLRAAFDPDQARMYLQHAFFGADPCDFVIERCKPGKATYLPGEGCLLRYELVIRQRSTGDKLYPLVLARVFPEQRLAVAYAQEQLAPLAIEMEERPEIAAYRTPIAVAMPLNMAVQLFPIDADLPALIPATDRAQMCNVLAELLPTARDGRFLVESCTVVPGHYGRQHRCLLRYEIEGRWNDNLAPHTEVYYGKIAADGRGELAYQALAALDHYLPTNDQATDHEGSFQIPRAFAYHPTLQLFLMESIPGLPTMPKLLKAYLAGGADDANQELSVKEALTACAQMAATLHNAPIALGEARTLADELATLKQLILVLRPLAPDAVHQMQQALQQVEKQAQQSPPLASAFSHGDFTYTQVLFDGKQTGLVDFDTICQAEPALDLGQFQAYLRLALLKAQAEQPDTAHTLADELCAHFMAAYLEAQPGAAADATQLRRRVQLYEMISLARIGLHSLQKLKEERMASALTLLEERISCLTPSTPPSPSRPPMEPIPSSRGQAVSQQVG